MASSIIAIAPLAAVHFDAFEDLAAWARRYDEWPVDDLLFLPIFSMIAHLSGTSFRFFVLAGGAR